MSGRLQRGDNSAPPPPPGVTVEIETPASLRGSRVPILANQSAVHTRPLASGIDSRKWWPPSRGGLTMGSLRLSNEC